MRGRGAGEGHGAKKMRWRCCRMRRGAVREGELGKAARLLDAVWGDVEAHTIRQALPKLYPPAHAPRYRRVGRPTSKRISRHPKLSQL